MSVNYLPTCGHDPLKYIAMEYESKAAVSVVCERCCQSYQGGYIGYTATNGSHVIVKPGKPKPLFIMVPLEKLMTETQEVGTA